MSQYTYRNDRGDKVSVDFLGVMDLMALGPEAADDEVYDIVTRVLPDKRRGKLIPSDHDLIKRASWCDPQRGVMSRSNKAR